MKMGAFVMGGIVGAALTVAIRRSPKWSMAASMIGHEIKNRSFGKKEGAIGKMFDMRFGSDRSERKHAAGAKSAAESSSDAKAKGFGDIAHLISQDADVREDVNEILSENGQHRI
ncbi:hypothetical protein [Cohnella sp. 56]|uniref:hypothetical protein n=1 Tax=Cohnella sp. 56 TaxID=3113722 RepID=UPI0030E80F2C